MYWTGQETFWILPKTSYWTFENNSPKLQKYYLVKILQHQKSKQPRAMNINIFWICILLKNIHIFWHTLLSFFQREKPPTYVPRQKLWKHVHPLMGQLLSQQVIKCKGLTYWKHFCFRSSTFACHLNIQELLFLYSATSALDSSGAQLSRSSKAWPFSL